MFSHLFVRLYVLHIYKISISYWYRDIWSISYRNWNPDIELSPVTVLTSLLPACRHSAVNLASWQLDVPYGDTLRKPIIPEVNKYNDIIDMQWCFYL